MIGGTTRFHQVYTPSRSMRNGEVNVTPQMNEVISIVKELGEVELRELSNILGISWDDTRRAVENATFAEGSRIYEDRINGHPVIGWLE